MFFINGKKNHKKINILFIYCIKNFLGQFIILKNLCELM